MNHRNTYHEFQNTIFVIVIAANVTEICQIKTVAVFPNKNVSSKRNCKLKRKRYRTAINCSPFSLEARLASPSFAFTFTFTGNLVRVSANGGKFLYVIKFLICIRISIGNRPINNIRCFHSLEMTHNFMSIRFESQNPS